MRVVADRLSLRWYLGYDQHEPLPDHSSLTRIRERFGLEVFRRFFERIVEECFEAGLVWGEELFFDATKVEANASLDSTRSRSLVEGRLQEHLVEVFPEDTLSARDEVHSRIVAGVVGPEGDERQALAQTNAGQHRWIAEAGRQERGVVRWGYKRMADLRVSTTDPDASPMHQKKRSASRLGYLTHYVVDGGKARVILDALVTGAEVTENLPMPEMLFRSTFRWRLRPRSSHRGCCLRHNAEHSDRREGRHPRLRRAARPREAQPPVRQGCLHLRRRERPLHLPPRRDPAPSRPRPQRGHR